jgi:pimeloyl-ACP methyl ester carboxylesterase
MTIVSQTRVHADRPAGLGQLTPHRAGRVELPCPHGPLAALAASPTRGDLGATVLLLPGYTGSKEDFAPVLDPLLDAGLGVLAVDLPGQYESGGPDDEDAYLPQALGKAIAGLIGQLGPRRVVLVGHSFGGLVARAAVLAGATVSGLVLLCCGPGELPPGVRRTMLELGEPIMREQGIHAVQSLREALQAAEHRQPPPTELAAFLRTRFLRTSASSLLGMGTALRNEPDLVTELATTLTRTATPCLVACGEFDDAWLPSAQQHMAARLGAPFVTIPTAGHSPNTENPAALAGTLITTVHTWLERA